MNYIHGRCLLLVLIVRSPIRIARPPYTGVDQKFDSAKKTCPVVGVGNLYAFGSLNFAGFLLLTSSLLSFDQFREFDTFVGFIFKYTATTGDL